MVSVVGRARELGELASMLDDAIAGSGRLVAIIGEPGIGKTTLCEALAESAQPRGAGLAWVACWDAMAAPPLWAPSRLLEQLAVEVPPSTADDGDPDVARLRQFDAIADALRAASEERPLVLILDDLQWADQATMLLLGHVAPLLRTMRVLAVTAVRETPGMQPALLDVLRRASRLRLGALSRDEIAEIAAAQTGESVSSPALDALHGLTAGNPLFASELARWLGRDVQSLGTAAAVSVPSTVRAVLDLRLRAVDAGARELLAVASVVGSDTAVSLVGSVCGLAVADVVERMESAIDAGVVVSSGPGRVAFTHPLLRAAIADDLSVGERARLHLRVAEAMESMPAPDLAALAFHYLHAPPGSSGKAVSYAERAAADAMRLLAYEDAAALYERALDAAALDSVQIEPIPLLLGLASARSASGDVEGARAALLDAAALARGAGRASDLAAAALGIAGGGFEVALFDAEHIALLEEALAAIGDSDPSARSRLCARLSVALSLSGAEARRRALADEAVDLAVAARDDGALAHALAARCDVTAGPLGVSQRAADATRIIEIGEASRDGATELLGRRLRIVAACEAGDLRQAELDLHRFGTVANRLGQPRYQWYVPLWRGSLVAARGQLEEQKELLEQAEVTGARARSANMQVLTVAQRWFMWLETGEDDTAAEQFERLLPDSTIAQLGVQMVPTVLLHRAVAGRHDEAHALLARTEADLRAAPFDSEWLPMMVQLAEVCFRLGGHPIAVWLTDALKPVADRWGVEGIAAYLHGPVHRQLGSLAALLGRPEDAARHFDDALAQLRGAGADLLVARTLLDRGVALRDDAPLREARELYRAIGTPRRVDEIDALLRETPPVRGDNVFRLEGEWWLVRFAGRETRVRDSKGMRDLARLLETPGRSVAAIDLAEPSGRAPRGDAGDVIDARARAEYKARLVDLEAELAAADAAADVGRSATLAAERDALVAQLAGAYGLGGRSRRAGDTAERARTTVTSRIRDAIRRLDGFDTELGRHLRRAVRTGTFCVYDPDPPTNWIR